MDFHVSVQRICAKVKKKLVLSVVDVDDTWISLGPYFLLTVL
jgi:hypothetical protein